MGKVGRVARKSRAFRKGKNIRKKAGEGGIQVTK